MLRHGFTPEGMLVSTIIPIPKNAKRSLNDSDNYRGIALASRVGKLLDWILMLRQNKYFDSSDYQFGCKSDSSSTKNVHFVNKVINYYMKMV